MGSYIGSQADWKMVELSGLEKRLRKVNQGKRPCITLYLYEYPAYCTVYGIMGLYKNYPNKPKTPAQNRFNKAMVKLHFEVEYRFALHQNLWT